MSLITFFCEEDGMKRTEITGELGLERILAVTRGGARAIITGASTGSELTVLASKRNSEDCREN